MNKMRDYLLKSEVSETMVKEIEGDLEDLKNIVKELEKTISKIWTIKKN